MPSGVYRLYRHTGTGTQEATRERAAPGRGPDEGDDVAATFATDGARGFDPLSLLRAMSEAGSYAVVIGQVAGIMHGSTELTGDRDLLWDGSPQQAHALKDALLATGCTDLHCLDQPKADFRAAGVSGDLCAPTLPWNGIDTGPASTARFIHALRGLHRPPPRNGARSPSRRAAARRFRVSWRGSRRTS